MSAKLLDEHLISLDHHSRIQRDCSGGKFRNCCYRLIWVIVCVQCLVGCRALRNHRQIREQREQGAARQLSLRGHEALQQEKYIDAESFFGEAIRQSPVDERAQWGYAEVLWQRGQRSPAIEHMTQAVAMSGDNPDLIVRLGQMYLEQQELPRAAEQAGAALRIQRKHAGAWALKGDVLRQQSQLSEALDCYQLSLIYRADAPQVQVALAEIYRQVGRPQRALATLDHLADHHAPEQVPPRAWLLKGQALADMGEDSEAQRYFRLASQYAGEKDSGLLLELAAAQHACGDLAEARFCLGRVLQHEPENPGAMQLQSQLDQSFMQMAADQSGRVPAMHVPYQRSPITELTAP